jgi:CheY-like chemotaxis protein
MARILFIDDDPLTLQTLKKSVELFGHQAILANSGSEALALAVEQSPDLIMTDMSLPDMDGLSLIKRFQQEQVLKDIPMVMLSASPELDASQLALAAGAREFVTKPVRLQTLQQVIQRYTGG